MQFTLQGVGPFLHWLTLGVLVVAPILIAYVIYKLGSLPGAIARSRNHPQADAIGICGWMGIITIVLWPIAMVWAYLVPGRPVAGPEHGAPEDRTALTSRLQQLSQRIAAIESELPKPTTGGA
ncbi:DUF3302 domain-containing protein [Bradyrhizobium monzae]|uniref:DUF3302 domain-containing protein n=1 Tax=Bradyrhizobium sp. Oc8 TaxID=2876780 RepID=UPI001F3E91B7|nr:DUF3302 domain-containing protein [Bradyrhizobium sp. Oc8]